MATHPHGGTNKIEKLLAYHEQAAAAIRLTLSLMNGHAIANKTNGHGTNGHASILANAIALDNARNGNGNGHPEHAPRSRKRRRRPNGEGKKHLAAQRARSLAILGQFDRKRAIPSETVAKHFEVSAARLGLGPLIRFGYLRRKGSGYLRTAKPYDAAAPSEATE